MSVGAQPNDASVIKAFSPLDPPREFTWVVTREGKADDRVVAHSLHITAAGALAFMRNNVLMRAYGPGSWLTADPVE